jgi:hypothetical protein
MEVVDAERNLFFFSFSAWSGSKPLIGKVSPASLRLHKRIWYHNGFQTHLFARVRPMEGGTKISGTFGMHPFTRVFAFIWFGCVVGFVLYFLFFFLLIRFPDGIRRSDPTGILIAISMLGFGYALIRFGRYLARNEAQFIAETVIKAVDGYRS